MSLIAFPWKINESIAIKRRHDINGNIVASVYKIVGMGYVYSISRMEYSSEEYETIEASMTAADNKLETMKYRLINDGDPLAHLQ